MLRQVEDIMRRDPGNRGLAHGLSRENLPALTVQLWRAQRIVIVTGFPISSCGVGETDGPPGAVNLAAVLHGLGKRVCLVTDPLSDQLVRAGVALRCPQVQVEIAPLQGGENFCRALLGRFEPTHVIAIERPGKGADGHYHNARGEIIDALVADTDALLRDTGAATIAIGDGGNELGMGALRAEIERKVPFGPLICADCPADYTLVSGVSNWWGWGIAALLSVKAGRSLLPSDDDERALLAAVVRAGGVDGVTCKRVETVDSLSLEDNLDILRAVRDIVHASKEATV